jgi:hypothetical protein
MVAQWIVPKELDSGIDDASQPDAQFSEENEKNVDIGKIYPNRDRSGRGDGITGR